VSGLWLGCISRGENAALLSGISQTWQKLAVETMCAGGFPEVDSSGQGEVVVLCVVQGTAAGCQSWVTARPGLQLYLRPQEVQSSLYAACACCMPPHSAARAACYKKRGLHNVSLRQEESWTAWLTMLPPPLFLQCLDIQVITRVGPLLALQLHFLRNCLQCACITGVAVPYCLLGFNSLSLGLSRVMSG
jgi:hypothetical protein